MLNVRHKEVLKTSTSKGAELSTSDAEHDDRDNGSSPSFEDLNFRGFMDEEKKVLSSMIRKAIIQKEPEEFKRSGIMSVFRNEMATYPDFTACDVPKFDGVLDPMASTRWLAAIEGDSVQVIISKRIKNFASNFLRDSAKMW
ncbi:hypothetical protein Tco_0131412 [Tanacetum coccineum]